MVLGQNDDYDGYAAHDMDPDRHPQHEPAHAQNLHACYCMYVCVYAYMYVCMYL
jgi:hypothetical protein